MAANPSLMTTLSRSPWWASVVFAGFVYLLMAKVAPAMLSNRPHLAPIATGLSHVAWLSAIFLLPGLFSLISSLQKKQRFDGQSRNWSPDELSWRQFEELLEEAYRRRGFAIRRPPSEGADGGIDLDLERNGRRYLVQCKHWKRRRVGVQVIREIFGVLTAERAAGAFVVTSGSFTPEAVRFAARKPIRLVDGEKLEQMITGASTSTTW